MDNKFFKNIEGKTGVNMQDVFQLANSLQGANFKDEKTIRNTIQQVSKLANKPVKKELEDKIVKTLLNGDQNIDFTTIANMINKKK